MSIVRCQISGVKYLVSSDNMSSISVRYQVSGINILVSGKLNTESQYHISGNYLVM